MGVLGHIGMKILETLFFIGVAGSTVVLILSAIEDIETLVDKGDSH
jgi:hypothetical protein